MRPTSGPARRDGRRLRRPPRRRRRPVSRGTFGDLELPQATASCSSPAGSATSSSSAAPTSTRRTWRRRSANATPPCGRTAPPSSRSRPTARSGSLWFRRSMRSGRTRPPRCWPPCGGPWPKRTNCRLTPSSWSDPAASRAPPAARSSAPPAARSSYWTLWPASWPSGGPAGKVSRERRPDVPRGGHTPPTAATGDVAAHGETAAVSTLTDRPRRGQRRRPSQPCVASA